MGTVHPSIQIVALNTVGRTRRESPRHKSFVLALGSDGVVNERFENERIVSAVQHSLQDKWKSRDGPDFSQAMSLEVWTHVAASVLSTTKHSNGGDNQSIHLAHLTQNFGDQTDMRCETGEGGATGRYNGKLQNWFAAE